MCIVQCNLLTPSETVTWLLALVFLPIKQREDLMGWHPREVTRTRIRVIGINFGEILIKGEKIKFELAEVRVIEFLL